MIPSRPETLASLARMAKCFEGVKLGVSAHADEKRHFWIGGVRGNRTAVYGFRPEFAERLKRRAYVDHNLL